MKKINCIIVDDEKDVRKRPSIAFLNLYLSTNYLKLSIDTGIMEMKRKFPCDIEASSGSITASGK